MCTNPTNTETDSPTSEPLGRAAGCLDPATPLEELVRRATELTAEHFTPPGGSGWRMLLYAPLYLSSHCVNHCAYCGFRAPEAIQRKHLSVDEALRQADILQDRGFEHLLLVAGDFPRLTTTEYFVEIIRSLVERGVRPAVEIAPQTAGSYAEMAAAGACGVTLYQETYNEQLYTLYHPRGSKTSYQWRLEGLRRAAGAGIGRLGLGVLLGLADPREDLLALLRHGDDLQSALPGRTVAFSLPRIHEAPAGFETPYPIDDETFVRLYCTLRIVFPRAELVLSTRESVVLRNRLAKICITQLSAGSSTVPGGYEDGSAQSHATSPAVGVAGQFPVTDDRSAAEMAEWLCKAGFSIAWNTPAE
ncbi:MAG: radical SAM protein [Candidatus Nealsonbacteria bacterium]|nr:radical SAM protein [Candidatus Nealsonbacteria bacterium]